MTDPRINLSDAAIFTVRGVSLTLHRIDDTTLGTALTIATAEFGTLIFPLTITDVRVLGETCTRAAQSTPQEMAALMAIITNNEGEPENE